MKKNKFVLLASLSVAAVMGLASCGEKKSTGRFFDDEMTSYNENLNSSSLFKQVNAVNESVEEIWNGDTSTASADTIDELRKAGFTSNGLGEIEGYNSSYEKVTVGYGESDISSWGTDNNIIYPGSIVRVQDPTQKNSAVSTYGVNSGNINISTSMYTSTGTSAGSVTREVKKATLSNVRNAISELVKCNLVEGSNHACQISSSVQEIKNSNEFDIIFGKSSSKTASAQLSSMLNQSSSFFGFSEKLGGDASSYVTGNAKIVENSNYSTGFSNYYACIQLTQVYYSMEIDPVMDYRDVVLDNLSNEKIEDLKSKGGVPGIVNSVKFGRKAICLLELDCSYSDYVNEVNNKYTTSEMTGLDYLAQVGYNSNFNMETGGDYNNEDTSSETTNTHQQESTSNHVLNSKCFIYGGDSDSSLNALQSTTATEIIKSFTSSVDPLKMVGCPISYSIGSLDGSNSTLVVGNSDTYYRRVLTPITPNGKITLSEEDIEKLDNIKLGTTITISPSKNPSDAIFYDVNYSLKFDDDKISSEETSNGLTYKVGTIKLATLTKTDDGVVLKLENNDYLSGKTVTFSVAYDDTKFTKYNYSRNITIKASETATSEKQIVNLNTLGTTTVNYDRIDSIKQYFDELNKDQLTLSDLLSELTLEVDYTNNTVQINSISGKTYDYYVRQFGTDYYEYFTTLAKASSESYSEPYDYLSSSNNTGHEDGWSYGLKFGSQEVTSGVLTNVTDFSNVTLLICVEEDSQESCEGSDEWRGYYLIEITLDLSK